MQYMLGKGADQLYEALDAFRAAARLMKDPALKMAIGDVLEEVSVAGIAKVLLSCTVATYHVQSEPQSFITCSSHPA